MQPSSSVSSDDLDMFQQADRAERRVISQRMHKSVADTRARAAELEKPDAKAVENIKAFSKATNERMIRAEYRRLGIEPRPGQLVSVTLLFQAGWRIEDGPVQGERVLVAPKPPPPYEPRDRDSLPKRK